MIFLGDKNLKIFLRAVFIDGSLYTHHGWPCSLCWATAKPNIHWPSQCRLGASWITLLFTSTLKECAKFKPNTNNVQFKILMMKLTLILHTLSHKSWSCKKKQKRVRVSCFSGGLPPSYTHKMCRGGSSLLILQLIQHIFWPGRRNLDFFALFREQLHTVRDSFNLPHFYFVSDQCNAKEGIWIEIQANSTLFENYPKKSHFRQLVCFRVICVIAYFCLHF